MPYAAAVEQLAQGRVVVVGDLMLDHYVFGAVDRVRTGIHWLKQHPALPVLIATALLVARPRAALRWVRCSARQLRVLKVLSRSSTRRQKAMSQGETS